MGYIRFKQIPGQSGRFPQQGIRLKVLVLRPSDYIAHRIPLILRVTAYLAVETQFLGWMLGLGYPIKNRDSRIGGGQCSDLSRMGGRDGIEYAPRR